MKHIDSNHALLVYSAILEQTEEDGQRAAGLTIADRPDSPLKFAEVEQLNALPPAAQGAASIEFLDEAGKVVRSEGPGGAAH